MLKEVAEKISPNKDLLGSLTDGQKRVVARDNGLTLNQTINLLLEAAIVPLHVHVTLVGFGNRPGEVASHSNPRIHEADLMQYLNALQSDLETVALNPEPQLMLARPRLLWSVSVAEDDLVQSIDRAITQAVDAAPVTDHWSRKGLTLIPHTVVEDVLKRDDQRRPACVVVYILNPRPQGKQYVYDYDNSGNSCPGQVYVSENPVVWVDLTAEASFYGPGPGGKGQVFRHSVPRLSHYAPGGGPLHAALLPDITALVWSAVRHLVWPPLFHARLHQEERVTVQLLYLHDTVEPDRSHLPAAELERTLSRMLAGVQKVEFAESWLSLLSSPLATAAYSRAKKVRTGRAPGTEFNVQRSHFLDSEELRAWLGPGRDEVLGDAGLHTETAGQSHRILPVFVFDLATREQLLLDGWRQAVAFEDFVVAVRTQGPPITTYFVCNQASMELEPHNITRAVLASVLQSGWGVEDVSIRLGAGGVRDWSHLWSVGSSPFGPLSSRWAALSFAQRHAAPRNLALAALNTSLGKALPVLHALAGLRGADKRAKQVLSPELQRGYHSRVNLLHFKVHQASWLLYAQRHAEAVRYARAAAADAAALLRLAARVEVDTPLHLACHASHAGLIAWTLPLAGLGIAGTIAAFRAARGGRGERRMRRKPH